MNSTGLPKGSKRVGTRTGTLQVSWTLGATTGPTSVGLRHLSPGRWASKAAALVNAHPHSAQSTSLEGVALPDGA